MSTGQDKVILVTLKAGTPSRQQLLTGSPVLHNWDTVEQSIWSNAVCMPQIPTQQLVQVGGSTIASVPAFTVTMITLSCPVLLQYLYVSEEEEAKVYANLVCSCVHMACISCCQLMHVQRDRPTLANRPEPPGPEFLRSGLSPLHCGMMRCPESVCVTNLSLLMWSSVVRRVVRLSDSVPLRL